MSTLPQSRDVLLVGVPGSGAAVMVTSHLLSLDWSMLLLRLLLLLVLVLEVGGALAGVCSIGETCGRATPLLVALTSDAEGEKWAESHFGFARCLKRKETLKYMNATQTDIKKLQQN